MSAPRQTSAARARRWRATLGRVFVISSPSGGGKTTVVERVLRTIPRLVRSVSVTTRAPRRGECRGRDYQFMSTASFDRLRRTGALLEWAWVHGAFYGTPKQFVLEALAQGQDVILSIDVQGARKIRRAFGAQAVLIFLVPPSLEDLRQRLLTRRTETAPEIRKRLTVAAQEIACASWYDHTVVNDRLQQAIARVKAIVRAARRRAIRPLREPISSILTERRGVAKWHR